MTLTYYFIVSTIMFIMSMIWLGYSDNSDDPCPLKIFGVIVVSFGWMYVIPMVIVISTLSYLIRFLLLLGKKIKVHRINTKHYF